jgi:hypothetical protein
MSALTVEAWLNGTKAELRALWTALQNAGAITYTSELHPLEDGRHRLYVRLNVAVSPTAAPAAAPRTERLPLAS